MKKINVFVVTTLIFCLLTASAFAQSRTYRAGIITVERWLQTLRGAPILNNGYYRQVYSGNAADAFKVDYTGSGHMLFNILADGSPVFTLTKAGALDVVGHVAMGDTAAVHPRYTLVVKEIVEAVSSDYQVVEASLFAEPTGDSTAIYVPVLGQYLAEYNDQGSPNYSSPGYAAGVAGISTFYGTGTYELLFGLYGKAISRGTGTITNLVGLKATARNLGIGTTAKAIAILAEVQSKSTGKIEYGYGLYVEAPDITSTFENNYGIYLEDQTGPTNTYSIYSVGGDNYLGGDLGVGGTVDIATGESYMQNGNTILKTVQADYNTFVGKGAGAVTGATGDYNTFVGEDAGKANTVGDFNTVLGYSGLLASTSGANNSAVGIYSLASITQGAKNSAVGTETLYSNQAGCENIAMGYRAGRYLANGSSPNTSSDQGIYLGTSTKALEDGTDNEIVIGFDTIGSGSDTITLGNSSITTAVLKGGLVYFGQGIVAASPAGSTLNASGGSGTNNPGGELTLAGGKGTGDADGGEIVFATSAAGGAGSSLNSLTDHFKITADGNFQGVTSKWYFCKYVDAINAAAGGSGATFTLPDANTLGGYQLDAATEYLYFNSRTCPNWDEASDVMVAVTFEVNIDNTGGGDADTVDFSLLCYYKGDGEIVNKTQTATSTTVVGKSPQYKQFIATLVIDHDIGGGNDVDVRDVFSLRVNLDTAASEVDNVIVNFFMYHQQGFKVQMQTSESP